MWSYFKNRNFYNNDFNDIEIGAIETIYGNYIGIMVNITNQFAAVVPVYFNLSLYNVSCSAVGRLSFTKKD